MVPKKKQHFTPHIAPSKAPPCEVPGCTSSGGYKAPKSKKQLYEYQWYCLDHIRQYNEQWDFFKDMGQEEIETFMKDAVTGHRPTWGREKHFGKQQEKLQQAINDFLGTNLRKGPRYATSVPPKIRKALVLFDMEYPFTVKGLKSKYRTLVKQYHPDLNRGNKLTEEKFKSIATAYHLLSEYLNKLEN